MLAAVLYGSGKVQGQPSCEVRCASDSQKEAVGDVGSKISRTADRLGSGRGQCLIRQLRSGPYIPSGRVGGAQRCTFIPPWAPPIPKWIRFQADVQPVRSCLCHPGRAPSCRSPSMLPVVKGEHGLGRVFQHTPCCLVGGIAVAAHSTAGPTACGRLRNLPAASPNCSRAQRPTRVAGKMALWG